MLQTHNDLFHVRGKFCKMLVIYFTWTESVQKP